MSTASCSHCSHAAINQVFEAISEETGSAKELHSGLFLARPKTYDLSPIVLSARIA
jgi:hypothetical protein